MAYKYTGPVANDAYCVAPLGTCERRLCIGAMSVSAAPKVITLGALLVMACDEGAAV